MSQPKNRRAVSGVVIAAIAILLVFALPAVLRLWVDLAWFEELGHPNVLLTPLYAKLGLGAVSGAVAFALIGGNAYLALRLSRNAKGLGSLFFGEGDAVQIDLPKAVGRVALPFAAIVSFLIGMAGSGRWQEWLLMRHGRPFGEVDPLFARDVGFYVFTLPFLDHLFSIALWVLVASFAFSVLIHAGRGGIGLRGGRLSAEPKTRWHLSLLASAVFVVLAYGAWLTSAHLVLEQTGRVAGAGYADVHARLPALRAHLAVALVAAAMIAISATRKRLVFVFAAVGLYLVVGLVGRGLYPALIQTYVVEPNELEREREFLTNEIAATRSAFALDAVTDRELSGDLSLSWEDVEANHSTIDNIRVWDHRPLLDTFGQIQEIRTYYDFVSVDNDRYMIDGELRQTMLSARELSSESLPNRTWINEHLTFTHGFGVALGPVNEADEEGLPRLFLQDIPPVSTIPDDIDVTRPQIYFGELSGGYVFVGSTNDEFDHPAAQQNVYRDYDGPAGIPVGGMLFRTALALETGDSKVIFSDDLSAESRVLLHRRVTDRVQRLAPFLRLDGDPYLVVRDNGTLAWIVDGYTQTTRFPYSRGHEGVSYIRNSVKAVVDAYDGTVTLYAADADDPILATWDEIFGGLMTPLSEMPEDLRAHVRYPADIFSMQATMLATYHMDEPELLYNREDQWEIPELRTGNQRMRMEPYYTVMRLPGGEQPEFIQMLPFTPSEKDNMAAWMVARSDGDHLGELVVYRFPNDRLVFGPQQVLNRINQDAHISQQLSLWDQRGSQADFGTLLVIPIEESLIYVLPLYLRSEGGRIPQLKRVVVVYDDNIAMANTLAGALAQVFGHTPSEPVEAPPEPEEPEVVAVTGDEVPPPPPPTALDGDPRQAALRSFERAVEAQRRGDWAAYGQELEALEAALRALQPEEPAE